MPFVCDDDPQSGPPIIVVIALAFACAFAVAMQLLAPPTPASAASRHAPESITIGTGQLTASEHELDAGGVGYFSIGQSALLSSTVVTPVRSEAWEVMRRVRGRHVELVLRVLE